MCSTRATISRMHRTVCVLVALAAAACVGAPAGSGPSAPAEREPEPARDTVVAGAARGRPILEAHNRRRAQHCAAPLRWSRKLARSAQRWADELARRDCAFEHSRTRYGENLAAGTEGTLGPERVVDLWFGEREDYDFGAGRFSLETGHFTQLVWRSTRRLGCGTSSCNGLDVWVCQYDPPGNVEGRFRAEVLPSSCNKN